MYFFAKYILNLPYIFFKKNPIFLYNFCQKWLDTLLFYYLLFVVWHPVILLFVVGSWIKYFVKQN
jgi:hypothetical protein